MQNKKKWFTLVELITVITIMSMLVMTVAIPYMYYQNKGKVRIASREIAQSFYEARNMAINGYSSGITNQSIGIYFDGENSKEKVVYFSYPYTFTGSQISVTPTNDIKIIKERTLPDWVQIDRIRGSNIGSTLDTKKALFFYSAVFWIGSYYSIDAGGVKTPINEGSIEIDFSYKWSPSENLKKSVIYYLQTNIVDY